MADVGLLERGRLVWIAWLFPFLGFADVTSGCLPSDDQPAPEVYQRRG